MESHVFNRVEKKYLITKSDKRALLKTIKCNMDKDHYHKSIVLNLYFDNDDYEMISESVDWVDFKKKIRARSYDGYNRVFMELKTKIRPPRRLEKYQEDDGAEENLGYKRRVMITHEDFEQLVNRKHTLSSLASRSEETAHDAQIAREIDYMLANFHLKPRIFITYNRESYKDNDGLRITFDENLKYRTKNLSLTKGKRDKIYFKKDKHSIIMEIKASGALPLWLVHELSEKQLYPQQFSKIGKVYQRIKLKHRKEQNV